MQVWLNDQPISLPDGMNIEEALEHWEHKVSSFAIAINQSFIPKDRYAHILINEGDHIDLVTPMQGG